MAGDILEKVSANPSTQIVYKYVERPALPEPGPPVEEVVRCKELAALLKRRGITTLFKYQAEAIKRIREGKHVFIMAGTGTGKTEAFLIPIIEDVLSEPFEGTRALLIYPTKALARDQLSRMNYYLSPFFGLRAMTLDGDTPDRIRRSIYEYPPQILLTNPDMIHFSLQYSSEFKELVSRARYVVLDDMHVYSGIFGSHVHYVLRRLKRFLRGEVVFIGSSATLGNPREFASKLFGVEVDVVSGGISRRGRIIHVLVSPKGKSKLAEALFLLRLCIREGLKTLLFVDSHRLAELIKLLARREGLEVEVHRAGLRPEERERIERKFKRGDLLCVVATPTLELGIDIGDLEVVILYNVPATFSRYIQRTGRVGRRGQTSYVFTILGDDPISSYYSRNPEEFFSRKPDPIFIDPENEEVMSVHLIAMARDSPYKPSELSKREREVVNVLIRRGLLRLTRRGYVRVTRAGIEWLKPRQNLRGIGDVVSIVTTEGRKIGEREMPMALKELHPEAIYLHGGTPYLVVDLKGNRAIVRRIPRDLPVVTSPLFYTMPSEGRELSSRRVLGIEATYLELTILDVVYGYVAKRFPTMELLSERVFDREYTYEFKTKGVLVQLPPMAEWDTMSNAEAFHAIEHALISAAQVVVGVSPTDLGGISFPSGHIYIYDSYPGGSGASLALFRNLEEAFRVAYDIVSKCRCYDGCPRCIYSPYCGNNNKILSRRRASTILERLLAGRLEAIIVPRSGKPIV